jgi:MFS family permease
VPTLTTKPAHPRRATTLRKDLRAIRLDGFTWALMSGASEQVAFSTFALAIGTSEVLTGLLSTVPMVMGALVQLVSPWGIGWVGSHRRWTVLTALIQAGAFIPLMIGAARGWLPAPLLFSAVAVYWAAGFSAGASWTALVGVLVPRPIRANYFAHRTRLNHLGIFLGLALTGLTLHLVYGANKPSGVADPPLPLWPFVAIFAGAAACRLVSSWQLARYSEAPATELATRPERLRPGLAYQRLRQSPAHSLLTFMFFLTLAAYTAGPFYAPFMLKQLKLSYLEFMILVGVAPLAKVASLPMLGRVAQRYGARRILWIAGLGVAPTAGAWIFSTHFAWLFAIQAVGGVMWAAYELATFLLMLEYVPEDQRTGVMTSWNLANAVAQTTGSFIGGAVLAQLLTSDGAQHNAYFAVFVLSSILRAACLILLWRISRPRSPSAHRGGGNA